MKKCFSFHIQNLRYLINTNRRIFFHYYLDFFDDIQILLFFFTNGCKFLINHNHRYCIIIGLMRDKYSKLSPKTPSCMQCSYLLSTDLQQNVHFHVKKAMPWHHVYQKEVSHRLLSVFHGDA